MKRSQNEDSHGCWVSEDPAERERRGVLMVVADGMGGSQAGEIASRLAVQTVIQNYRDGTSPDPLDDLYRAVEAANHVVHSESVSHPNMSGMGTTCVALAVRGRDAFLAHVGDSRAYLASEGKLRQLSQDHSLVAQLVRDGQLTPEQARSDPRRNVVTRSVGVSASVEVDAQRFESLLREGDTLLMCTDGLHGLVSDDELLEFASGPDLSEGCKRAIALANARGGHDNITVILARMQPQGAVDSHAEVQTGGRHTAWADADHDRDDVEHTQIMAPAGRPAARVAEPDDDPVERPRRPGRAIAIEEDDTAMRRRTMMWLIIAAVVLLLAIGAAALVLMQISRQSSALGANEPRASASGGASWR
jgi:protein phosphatase